LKVTNCNLPHLHLAPLLGVTPFEFCQDLLHQKTTVSGLSCGTVCVTLCLAVSANCKMILTAPQAENWKRLRMLLVVHTRKEEEEAKLVTETDKQLWHTLC